MVVDKLEKRDYEVDDLTANVFFWNFVNPNASCWGFQQQSITAMGAHHDEISRTRLGIQLRLKNVLLQINFSFRFLSKIWIWDFWPKFQFLTNISNFDFWPTCHFFYFLTKISILNQPKIWISGQSFSFSKKYFVQMFVFGPKFSTYPNKNRSKNSRYRKTLTNLPLIIAHCKGPRFWHVRSLVQGPTFFIAVSKFLNKCDPQICTPDSLRLPYH